MKIKNIKTNVVFDLPKNEVENLISENPLIYEKCSKLKKKLQKEVKPVYESGCILPLIIEKQV